MMKLTEDEIAEIIASIFRPKLAREQGEMFRALASGELLTYPETAPLRLCQKVRMHKVKKKIAKRGLCVKTFRRKGYLLDKA
jgi:hypothetical protein